MYKVIENIFWMLWKKFITDAISPLSNWLQYEWTMVVCIFRERNWVFEVVEHICPRFDIDVKRYTFWTDLVQFVCLDVWMYVDIALYDVCTFVIVFSHRKWKNGMENRKSGVYVCVCLYEYEKRKDLNKISSKIISTGTKKNKMKCYSLKTNEWNIISCIFIPSFRFPFVQTGRQIDCQPARQPHSLVNIFEVFFVLSRFALLCD